MSPAQFAILREILCTLPGLSREQRRAYVESACSGDEELVREAEAFLDLQLDTPGILKTGALTSVAREALDGLQFDMDAPMPERIGPYRILGVLGRGGMGLVYRGEQTEPMRREVAIKVMRGSTRPELIATRFAAERQALAVMEHPNIARVLDASSTEQGDPYFVMELVRGLPITRHCEREFLSLRQRLELFRGACAGVRHAHQKGIIHRDLKPSNLLVAEVDGHPAVKIIDFGIARALETSGLDASVLTQDGHVLGTPEYMSPEQAVGEMARVDVRSDVYSLGVILYELVSGRLPYDVSAASILARAKIINETPPAPLRQRHTTFGVDDEIEAIVRKALEKDPEDRYTSVAALGEDLDRYLRGEAILAHPPSTMYQLKKLVRRHRLRFAFLLTVAALLLGFAVTMAFMFDAQRAQRAAAELEARKAQRINGFLQEMLSSVSPFREGKDVTVQEVLDEASRTLDGSLKEEPATRLELHRTLATTYRELGDYDAAERHLDAATELSEALGPEDGTPARLALDRSILLAARGLFEEGEAQAMLALELTNDGALRAEILGHLNAVAATRGHYAEAESLAFLALDAAREIYSAEDRQVIEAEEALGDVLLAQGRSEEAEQVYRRTSKLLAQLLGENDTRVLTSLNQLAVSLDNGAPERRAESYRLMRRVLDGWLSAMGPDHPGVAIAHNNLSSHLMTRGERLAEAEEHMMEALRIWRLKLEKGHPYLLIGCNNLGYLRQRQLDPAGAELAYREGLALRDFGDPDSPNIALLLDNLSWSLLVRGRAADAETTSREANRLRSKIFAGDATWWRKNISATLLCNALADQGRDAAADSVGAPLLIGIANEPPNFLHSMLRNAMAVVYARSGRLTEADSLLAQSTQALLNSPDSEKEWIPERIYALQRSANLAESWGRIESARAWRERTGELRQLALASIADSK